MITLKNNEQRGTAAIVVIWLLIGATSFSLLTDFFQYHVLNKIARQEQIPFYTMYIDAMQVIASSIFLICYIVYLILFIMWFRRAYYNLHQITPYLSFSEGWAAGAWFVPILGLIRPYKIMRELYEVTTEQLENAKIDHKRKTLLFVNIWWAFFVLNTFFFRIISREFSNNYSSDIDSLITNTAVSILGDFLDIILFLFTIKVIRDYSKTEIYLPILAEQLNTEKQQEEEKKEKEESI